MESFIPLLFVVCLSFSACGFAAPTFSGNIPQICSLTLHPDLCVETLSDMPVGPKATLDGFVAHVLDAAKERAANISTYLAKNINAVSNTQLQQCFNDCSESYMDAVALIESTFVALENKKFDDVNNFVAAAKGDSYLCRNSCELAPVHDRRVLGKINTEFHQLCGIALSLTKQIK